MVKEELLKKEPLAYTCLLNDLKNDNLAHSYLFCGDKNPLKLKTAYLFAQSIIENKNDFACEVCDNCLRIKNNSYLDVIFIDGDKELIKKENMEEVLEEFSKTATEASGKKIYIISNINNATNKVLNMILKFMEEPSNTNTFGIFITDNIKGLQETVVSRCERINFISCDYSEVKKEYLNNGYSLFDAYLLSEINHEYLNDNDVYLLAKDYVIKLIDNINNIYYFESIMISEVYPLDNAKEIIQMMIKMMVKILDDSLSSKEINDEDYDSIIYELKDKAIKLLEIFLEASKVIERSSIIDHKLLFDGICSKIIED